MKRGDVRAMYQLGKMLMTGDGVERNYKAAYNLFSKSAKEGYAKSFNKMALMHQKGMGRPGMRSSSTSWLPTRAAYRAATALATCSIRDLA